jgi:alpha-beta hydrolase superfamily lysophospholipase
MAHGTSATVQMVAIEYARAFARAGIAALIYDHRNFGRSGGEPRNGSTRGFNVAAIAMPWASPSVCRKSA